MTDAERERHLIAIHIYSGQCEAALRRYAADEPDPARKARAAAVWRAVEAAHETVNEMLAELDDIPY